MIFQQAGQHYDLSGICLYSLGLLLLVAYAAFCYFVTHSGDFYHMRRWKAAIWFAGVPTAVATAILVFFSIAPTFPAWASKNVLEIGGLIVAAALTILTLTIPLLLVLTWGLHHQLKWWLNSDELLDKIWKDPNKEHKSPIQEI